MNAVTTSDTIKPAAELATPPVALLSAAAALPHLLKNAEAAAPARRDAAAHRQRRLWGSADGFTMAGMRR